MPGTNNLQTYDPLRKLVLQFAEEGKMVAAICAAPKILGELGLLQGKNACCHPGFEEELGRGVDDDVAHCCTSPLIRMVLTCIL